MYHFFVEPANIGEEIIRIDGDDYNHIRNVLRMKPGEEISVSNGQDNREFRCEVSGYGEDYVDARILFIKEGDYELPMKVFLFQGLPKGDKMEVIIQKCVELGVHTVVPVAMSRSIVKLDDKKAAKKVERYNEISKAAAKQSQRAIVPKVDRVMSFKEACEMAACLDYLLVPYELAEDMSNTRTVMGGIKPGMSVGVYIGPEGGIAPKEIELLKSIGGKTITLGKRILRTETAGMTVLSWLVYLLEGME